MKLKISIIVFVFLASLFGIAISKHAYADTITLSGTVKNSTGEALVGATVSVNDINSDYTITDSLGHYTLNIAGGTYNVQVSPPPGSSFSSAVALNQNISTDTILNFILTPAGTVTLSGHVYDASGGALANQSVVLTASDNTNTTVTTDSSGSYSLQVSSGRYGLNVSGTTSNFPSNVPQDYSLGFTSSLGGPYPVSLTQSTVLDITLPAKQVEVHIQDASGNAVSGIAVGIAQPGGGAKILGSIGDLTMVNYGSDYGSATGPYTDDKGNATLWVLPNDHYTITAYPPTGSIYSQTLLSNLPVSDAIQQTVTLQQSVIFNGHIYDASGVALANQSIVLTASDNTQTKVDSDSEGKYSFQVSPGRYGLSVSGSTSDFPSNVPQQYLVGFTSSLGGPYPISLTQNTVLDITLPAKQVEVHIQDASGNAVSGIAVGIAQPGGGAKILGSIGDLTMVNYQSEYGGATGPYTDDKGNATLWVLPNDHYTITAYPPVGSIYSQTLISNLPVSDAIQETIVLKQPVTLSGHVYDASGGALANQNVVLTASDNTNTTVTTDSSGSYSLQVSSGRYGLTVYGRTSEYLLNAPQEYYLGFTSSLGGPYLVSLTQNTVLDITLPAKQVKVHVQDASGNAVSGIAVGIAQPGGGSKLLESIGDLTMVNYGSDYGSATGPFTDDKGNATLWVLPNDHYTITAYPPAGSIYSIFTLNDLNINADQTELVSLQYSHNPPTTSILLTPDANAQGNYSNPTTVTLSATADSGYTIANTYFILDGEQQQIYTTPFTVSGSGNHTITYWSVDSSGVQEAVNTKAFTISQVYDLTGTIYVDTNKNGFQDSGEQGFGGATVTLNTGQSTVADTNGNYSFTGIEAGTYTVSASLPAGFNVTTTNPVSVVLSANTTENFGIIPQTPTVNVISVNPEPVQVNSAVSAAVTFSEPISNPLDTAVWNWGDGTTSNGDITEPSGTNSGSILGSHTYTTTGIYIVAVTITDQYGINATQSYQYLSVYNPTAQGLFSAGQQFLSPVGAYTQNPSLTGKAQFGLSYKYQGTMPVGDRQFTLTFSQANFTFNATTVTSFVTANGVGTITGTGTINNSGMYNYLVTGNGNDNTIRIRITDQSGNIFYDTQPGAATTAGPTTTVTGNVIVH